MTPEALTDLHNACFPDSPMSQAQIAALLAAPATRLFVVPNGFLIASIVPPEADITSLGVHPSARRAGHGRDLVQALQAEVDRIFLEVAATNQAAVHLYASLGFVTVARRPNYYKRGNQSDDALLMSWTSAAAEPDSPQESVDPRTG